ncbi:hypothetical protein C2W64_03501 [Brevibacillus laterosporus]|nr:hypothetical protein C2W64_03501 [Brevibacillus laterosporus]
MEFPESGWITGNVELKTEQIVTYRVQVKIDVQQKERKPLQLTLFFS